MTTGADRRLGVEPQTESITADGSSVIVDAHDAPALAPELGRLLLDAKFSIRPPRPGAVSRSGLVKTARSSGCRLVAITAPAGYGKSTFLAEWAASENRRVAWVSLDRFDDDPATLLVSLASAYCLAGLSPPDLVFDLRGQSGSVVGRAAPRLKKATLEGIFCFQMLFQGKNCSLWPTRRW